MLRTQLIKFGAFFSLIALFFFWIDIQSILPWHTFFTALSQPNSVLLIYIITICIWCFTRLDEMYVALSAATLLALLGSVDTQDYFNTLGDSIIWLLIASYMVTKAVINSGLAQRLIFAVTRKVSTINQLFYSLTIALIMTALFIPSTSARASLSVPIFEALTEAADDSRITRALALLFPTVIELSAIASLTGTAAHLIAVDLLIELNGSTISFTKWLMLGFPFALISCFLSSWVILHLFLNPQERKQTIHLPRHRQEKKPFSWQENFVMAVVGTMIVLWITSPWHGIDITITALLGALVLTVPKIGIMTFDEGLRFVDWSLIIFMASTLILGKAVNDSGIAEHIIQHFFNGFNAESYPIIVVSTVAIISLLSHLLIPSRTPRSVILVPLVILLASSLHYNPTALVFLSTAAAGFSLTLAICAKAVAMFSRLGYGNRDLLKMSSILLPMHLILLVVFSLFIWPVLGLKLWP